jgi:hypothetical protein
MTLNILYDAEYVTSVPAGVRAGSFIPRVSLSGLPLSGVGLQCRERLVLFLEFGAFVILNCWCVLLGCVLGLSWGEMLCGVGDIGGLPVRMCTEFEFGTLLN